MFNFGYLLILATQVSGAILGIDYGQQFAKAILLGPDHPFEAVLTEEAKRKDSTAIAIRNAPQSSAIERTYGLRSASLCVRFPHACPADLKSIMGLRYDDTSAHAYITNHFGIQIRGDLDRNNAITLDLGLQNQLYEFTPEELVAMHLLVVKKRALADLALHARPQTPLLADDVVMAVLPFASPEQRRAYLDALALVPFSNVLGLVDEGTAVALNFLQGKRFNQEKTNTKEYYVVFDMGAGSTTATVFSHRYNGLSVVEMELMGYDATLGGQYFTRLVHTLILEKFARKFTIDRSQILDRIRAKLWQTAEAAKITLTVNTEYQTTIELLYLDEDFKVQISRDEFEEFNTDIMERITIPISHALEQANIKLGDVKLVIVAGGLTRVPFVKKHLSAFVGESRILRTVNADELCSLGTTLRGLQWKTKFDSANSLSVIDKIYHNFEVSISGGEPIIVFPKLLEISNSSKVDLGPVADSVDIGLYQDGRLIKSFLVKEAAKRSAKTNCTAKAPLHHLFGTFKIDQSKMFDLTQVQVECVADEQHKKKASSFFSKLLNMKDLSDDEEEVVVDDAKNLTTNKNSTAPIKRKVKPVITYIPLPKATYPGVAPMSRTTRNRLLAKLDALNARDEAAALLSSAKNSLEAQCYSVREYLDSHNTDLVKFILELEIEQHGQAIIDLLSWLNTDDLELVHVEGKYLELTQRHQKLQTIVEMSLADLSWQGFQKVWASALEVAQKAAAQLDTHRSDLEQVQLKYENSLVNFTHFRDKVVARLVQSSVNATAYLETVAEFLEHVKAGQPTADMEEDEFSKISSFTVFAQQKNLTSALTKIESQLPEIEKSHASRIKLLDDKLEAQLVKRMLKQERERLKKEKAEEKKREQAKEEKKEEEEEQVVFVELDEEDAKKLEEKLEEKLEKKLKEEHDEL